MADDKRLCKSQLKYIVESIDSWIETSESLHDLPTSISVRRAGMVSGA